MISADQIVMLIGASAVLMLAANKVRGFGLSLETKVWIALVWALIIVALVMIGAHLPAAERFAG
jgi:hypothetical protein